jgi:hypothetical protein
LSLLKEEKAISNPTMELRNSMDNVIFMDAYSAGFPLRAMKFPLSSKNEISSLVFIVSVQSNLHSSQGYVCVKVNEFSMRLTTSD